MKAPQAPIMAAEGQVDDYAADWMNPSKAAVLRYKTTDADGNPVAMPQRLEPPTIPTGVVNASRGAVDDIKATMGMYNASIGQRSNETSGVAINQRKVEGEVAVFHFGDNLARSIAQVGRILVSAIPVVYDTPRTVRVVDIENKHDLVGINGMMVEGQEKQYDLTNGKYSVRVELGPSFTTQRQEAAQFFTDIVTSQPKLMDVAGDLLFHYMDMPGAQALSERFKRIIPPQIRGDDEQQDQDPEKLQMAQQLQESQMIIQTLQAEMKKLQDDVSTKQAEVQIKAQSEMNKAEQDSTKNELEVLKLQLEEKKIIVDSEIKAAELALKQRELNLKEFEAQARALQPLQDSTIQVEV